MNKEAKLEETKKMMQEISEAHDYGIKRFNVMKQAIRYKNPNDKKPEIKTRFTDDSCLNIQLGKNERESMNRTNDNIANWRDWSQEEPQTAKSKVDHRWQMDPFKSDKYVKHLESQKKSSYIAKNISHVQKLSYSNKKQKDE